jgi:hypothetical protein
LALPIAWVGDPVKSSKTGAIRTAVCPFAGSAALPARQYLILQTVCESPMVIGGPRSGNNPLQLDLHQKPAVPAAAKKYRLEINLQGLRGMSN